VRSGARPRRPWRRGRWLSTLAGVAVLGSTSLLNPAAAKNRGADGTFEKRVSSHFVLYQDVDIDRSSGFRGSRRFENQVLETLESAYDRLDQQLSLRPARRIDVVIYDPRIFDHHFGGLFRFSAAGFYSGTIHVRGDVQVDAALIRTLHHELVHAAFDATAPSLVLPAWLNEGVAEWFEARAVGKRQLSGGEFRVLSQIARSGQLFALEQLSHASFGHLDGQAAQVAYLQSYAFIDFLTREHGERSLRRLCSTLLRKRNLARAFEITYRRGVEELEARFVSQYRDHAGS
jgi:hypothetical protein